MKIPKQCEEWSTMEGVFSKTGCNPCSYRQLECGDTGCLVHTNQESADTYEQLIQVLEVVNEDT